MSFDTMRSETCLPVFIWSVYYYEEQTGHCSKPTWTEELKIAVTAQPLIDINSGTQLSLTDPNEKGQIQKDESEHRRNADSIDITHGNVHPEGDRDKMENYTTPCN